MRLNQKRAGIIVLATLAFALVMVLLCWPAEPPLIVPLADGSQFVLAESHSGSQFYYGGGHWQRMVCKMIGRPLPAFIRNQPQITPAFYTNGLALFFRRENADKTPLQEPWNGTGQLFYLDSSGHEHLVANRSVNFQVETIKQLSAIATENILWEMPIATEPELSLRMRKTNETTGAVWVHDFRIKNPAL